jgi:hypothetical protein
MEIFDERRLLYADSLILKNITEIKVVGKISRNVSPPLTWHTFSVVDISEADFIEKYKEEWLAVGFSHRGGYRYRWCKHHYDYLAMFINDVRTQKIILPPNIKRRHMNRIKENSSIKEVVVTDDCQLFTMKDGDVYNKKGTTLVFSNKK